MPHPNQEKSDLRREIRARRRALSDAERTRASNMVATNLKSLPQWQDATRIALYLSQDGEVDTGPVADLARSEDKALYLPVLAADQHMDFARWETGAVLVPNRYGIPEPSAEVPRVSAAELDVICLPLVAWTPAGDRLGMGGGYYDRTLAGAAALKVGLAYELQQRDVLPREAWDVGLNFVATESALHKCQG